MNMFIRSYSIVVMWFILGSWGKSFYFYFFLRRNVYDMQILTQNPSFLDWVPCFKGVTITVIIIPLSTHTNHPQWGTKLILFWQKWLQHFWIARTLSSAREDSATVVPKLVCLRTHSLSIVYADTHEGLKKKSCMYIHVCLCVYIYLYSDWHGQMNVEMIELSCFFFVCEYLYTVEQINKKIEAEVSSVLSLKIVCDLLRMQ